MPLLHLIALLACLIARHLKLPSTIGITLGGLLLGTALGALAYLTVRSLDDFATEMLVSLGLVLALTARASHLPVSATLAAVAAGRLAGSLTDRAPGVLSSRERFEDVWHLIAALLNVFLFALLALQVVALEFSPTSLLGLRRSGWCWWRGP